MSAAQTGKSVHVEVSVPDLIVYPPLLNRDIPKSYTSSWWFQLFQLCFTLVFSHLFREDLKPPRVYGWFLLNRFAGCP